MSSGRIRLAALMVGGCLCLLLLGGLPTGPDSLNYLLLARSLFFSGDLFMGDDLALTDKIVFVGRGGFPLELHNFGTIPFWAPFFALGHATAMTLAALAGKQGVTDGLTAPYVLWLRFGDACYGALALWGHYRLLDRVVARRPALALTLLLAVGSPAAYYMGAFAPSSHAVTLALAAAFVWLFMRLRAEEVGAWGWLAIGMLGGALLWVANTNLPLLVLPAVALLTVRPWQRAVQHAARFAGGVLLLLSPQMAAWAMFMGSPLRTPYSGQLAWTSPRLVETLFSPFHGLFSFTPLLFLAVLGLPLLLRWDRVVGIGALLAVALGVYINAANLAWWAGASFGARYLLPLTPLFALSLAALWARVGRVGRHLLAAAMLLAALWTVALFVGFAVSGLNMGFYYSYSALLAIAWQGITGFPAWVAGRLLRPEPLLVMLLPFLLAVAWLAWHLARRLRVNVRAAMVALMLAIPLLNIALWQRSHDALAACQRANCDQTWYRGEYDWWDRSATYLERAIYHARIGDHDAALADRATMIAVFPDNPDLPYWLTLVDEVINAR